MIGAHGYGTLHKYSTINKIDGPCMICGAYSRCEIIRYEKVRHSFFITLKVLQREYIFDWEKCGHRALLDRPEEVARYWEEQDKTNLSAIPYFLGMHLKLGPMPRKPSTLKIVLTVAALFAFWIVVYLVLNHLGWWPKLPIL